MNKHKPLIILAAILLLFIVSCNKNTSDALYKADIKAAQEWWQNSKQKLAKKNMRIPLQNGEILMGSISWQKAYSYTWRGNEYIEVPYVFNGVEKIIQGTDTTSYSLVLRVLNKDYFVGAISTTQTSSAPILGMDSSALIDTRTYTLLDGTEANTWLNDGSGIKSISPLYKTVVEIEALDEQRRKERQKKKEENTVQRFAITTQQVVCYEYYETYSYLEVCGDLDDGDPETLTRLCTGKGKRLITKCDTYLYREEDLFPSDGGGGGGGGISNYSAVNFDNAIKDSLTHDCLKSIFNTIKKVKSGNFALIISKLSGSIPNYNWILKEGTLQVNVNGTTSYTNNTSTTTFDYSKLKNATDLSVARIMIHEAIHAYLLSYFFNNPTEFNKSYGLKVEDYIQINKKPMNDFQHDLMVKSFVSDISSALKGVATELGYTNILQQVFDDMAWGGLTMTKAFSRLAQNDQDRISNRLTAEQTNIISDTESPEGKELSCK